MKNSRNIIDTLWSEVMNIRRITGILLIISIIFLIIGCGDTQGNLEGKIRQEYVKNNRLDKFYDLKERYDSNKIILFLNRETDSWWISNFTIWLVFLILPDIPEAIATGGIIALFYFVAWWLGVALTGGGILAVLAFIGTKLGVIPGIPPTLAGIIFLCVMFIALFNISSYLIKLI